MDLKLDALLNEASRRADGLSDFGDERFRAPAQVLLDAMNREGGLSAAGRQIWHSRLVELLRNRLLMEQFFKLHPEILDEEIGGPIVIVGLIALRTKKFDFGTICGILCGSMANPMALGYANDTLRGDTAAISYATVYPLGMFIRVIIAQVIVMFFV